MLVTWFRWQKTWSHLFHLSFPDPGDSDAAGDTCIATVVLLITKDKKNGTLARHNPGSCVVYAGKHIWCVYTYEHERN